MNYYNNPEKVKQYIESCDGYDGSNLYNALAEFLPKNSTLFELGSGAGFDIEYLDKNYEVTGSDLSDEFLKYCTLKFPTITFIKSNALDLKLNETFDCIYSNKVLHHLTKDELEDSLTQQENILSKDGLIAHSFWIGKENLTMNGMLYTYYKKEDIMKIISTNFDILSTLSYEEFEENDSLFVIAKVKK